MRKTATPIDPRRTRPPVRWAGMAAAVTAALLAVPVRGGDGVFAPSFFTSLVPGATVVVPLYVRDFSGTPLGGDAGTGFKIQNLAVTLTYSPAGVVSAVDVERAGVTAALTPLFETEVASGNLHSWVVAFDEGTSMMPLTVDATSPGDQVAEIRVTLAPSLPPNAVVTLGVVAPTALGNQPGTVAESLGNGLLASAGGKVGPEELFVDGFESGAVGAWSATIGGS